MSVDSDEGLSAEKLLALMDACPDQIALLDMDGHVRYANRASREAAQLQVEAMRAKAPADWGIRRLDGTAYADDELIVSLIKRKGEAIRGYEYLIERPDGTVCASSANAELVRGPDAEPEGIVVVARDITAEVALRKALRATQDELENHVSERTAELAEANERLRELDRHKSEFVATMSHELRTPLNSVIGFSSLLLEDVTTDEQHKQLVLIHEAAEHLLDIIDDILDVSKIESGRVTLDLEELTVGQVVSQSADAMEPMIRKKGLALIVEGIGSTPSMRGDRRKLIQVLNNLLSNAVKFTAHGRVKVSCGPRDDGRVAIRISDTGIGIAAENMEQLFQPFRQLDAGISRQYGGSGLGLYLTRKLVELMGGDITVESESGKGSTFIVTLPVVAPSGQE